MRILHISPYSAVPPNFGGALRIYHILRGLARRHQVTFVTIGDSKDKSLLALTFGEEVKDIHVVPRGSSPLMSSRWNLVANALLRGKSLHLQNTAATDMQATLDNLCQKNKYDIAILEFPTSGQFRLPEGIIRVLDEHNVEYSNLERMYKGTRLPIRKALFFREHRKLLREELDVCRSVDAIFTTSEHDRRVLDQAVPGKEKYVIPNGVETGYFTPSDAEMEPCSMVYTGTMDYFPNQDAMFYFLDNIFPIIQRLEPQAKLYIVGKNPPATLKRRASESVIITGFVPDVRPYTRRAAVYVVPLRMGSGTRLKILEGLAMKKAIVTTTIGCEGIDVENGKNVEIADEPELFARKVTALFRDEAKARDLGEQGYKLVKERYDWEVVSDKIESAIESIMKWRRSPAPPLHLARSKEPGKNNSHEDTIGVRPGSPIKVLMYHRVTDDNTRVRGYFWTVSKSQLRQQLELLDKWGYTCISFQDYSLFKKGELVLPKKPVILTFDDGYNEINANAVPVLREFGVKATMFVLGDPSEGANSWDKDPDINGAPLLDRKQIKLLHREGFEIGSHSMTHPYLQKLSEDAAWTEISASKKILEDLLQGPVSAFAYPFGIATNSLKSMVQSAGYEYGCGVFSGPPRFSDDTYNIRRIPMTRSTNLLNFAMKVLTPYEYYAWLRYKVRQSTLSTFSR